MAVMRATSPEAVELLAEFGQSDSEIPAGSVFDARYFRYTKINQSILEMLQANLLTSITDQDRELAVSRIRQSMMMPGFRATWPRLLPLQVFYPEFVEIVDLIMEEQDDA